MREQAFYGWTEEEILELLARRAKEYVPEWRYEAAEGDPGAAIAVLFSEMFYQTIDRFNHLPDKTYTEFLNMLGVDYTPVTPASGYVQFEVGGMGVQPVPVPAGTQVFAVDEDEESIVYRTKHPIQAVNANLAEVYYVDAVGGRIERLESGRAQPFFAPTGNENLQIHRMVIAHEQAFSLEGACSITLTIYQHVRFQEPGTAELLADPANTSWKYYDGREYVPFDGVDCSGNTIHLYKHGAARIMPDENGRMAIYCDFISALGGEMILKGISVQSRMQGPVQAQSLAHNDTIIEEAGGYCFGRRPAAYELFYIRADDVFCKHSAHVHLKLDIAPVIVSEDENLIQYEFSKRIIDKSDAVKVVLDDVYVQHVIWEYYNGAGWAKLEVGGNVNPFSCRDAGELAVFFDVPKNLERVLVNAEEGYYIRARVINVENYYSQKPRWILPFVKNISCDYQYSEGVPVQYVAAYHNAGMVEIDNAVRLDDLRFRAYSSLAPHPRAMYLRFDASPHAMPLSMLFEIWGEAMPGSKIIYEACYADRFEPLRIMDHTDNLRYSGAVFLYLPEELQAATFFGSEGYWLRMSLSTYEADRAGAPTVRQIVFNAVATEQMQNAEEQFFSAGTYEAEKTLQLLETPVLHAEVWVDEEGAIGSNEIAMLKQQWSRNVRQETDTDGVTHCWIRYEQVPSLRQVSGGARVYELDAHAGIIAFGNGSNGKVPPRGEQNIRVSYAYGGGSRGNIEAGRITALVGSIPRISGVSNITPMSGGTDRRTTQKAEALGNKRLRHRFRAVSTQDFEQITMEQFERAQHVKCFAHTGPDGKRAPGHICLVVMGRDLKSERMSMELCREIYVYLAERCDCNLIATGRLHVVPSTQITVDVQAEVVLYDLNLAAQTQQEITERLRALIEETWRRRDIGRQIYVHELYQAVKGVDNVASIERIYCEGLYDREGRRQLVPLDGNEDFPFATVRSGSHSVHIR